MNAVFDPLHMPPAEAFHFAVEFEIAPDLFVGEDAEAVNDGDGAAGHLDDFIGIEGEVGLVTDGQDDGIHAFERGAEIIFHPALPELLLVRKNRVQE